MGCISRTPSTPRLDRTCLEMEPGRGNQAQPRSPMGEAGRKEIGVKSPFVPFALFPLGFFLLASQVLPWARWQRAAPEALLFPAETPLPHRELGGRRCGSQAGSARSRGMDGGAERSSSGQTLPRESPDTPGSLAPSRTPHSRWDCAPDPSGRSLHPQVQCREDPATGPEHPLSKAPSTHRHSPDREDEASPSNPSRERSPTHAFLGKGSVQRPTGSQLENSLLKSWRRELLPARICIPS